MRRATILTALLLLPGLANFCPKLAGYVPAERRIDAGIIAASCQVEGCSGTAVNWRGQTFIVSAAHCFGLGQVVTFTTGDKIKGGKGLVACVSPELDLALIRVAAADITATVEVAEALPGGEWFGVGYPKSKGPAIWRGEFIGAQIITNLPRHRWAFKRERGDFKNGNSGSGVFRGGKLVGVATHADSDGMIYACPLQDLQVFLARAVQGPTEPRLRQDAAPRVAFPTAQDPAGWGDKDRTREILALKGQLEKLKAATGEPGPAGPAGPPGPGMDGAKLSQILERLDSLEDWTRNFRASVRVRVHPKE